MQLTTRESQLCLCPQMWGRHTVTLPVYEPKGLEWITSKLLSLCDFSFVPALVAVPEVGLDEARMPGVTLSSLSPKCGHRTEIRA